jgi:hypothetical protein
MMSPDAIRNNLEPIYRRVFGREGFEGLDVKAGLDHADEPAVFIRAKVKGAVDEILQQKLSNLRTEIFELFRREGEDRFPYIWVDYDDPSADEYRLPLRRRRS